MITFKLSILVCVYELREKEDIKEKEREKGRKGFSKFQLILFMSLKLIRKRKLRAYNIFL